MTRPVVALDIDDVMADTTVSLLRYVSSNLSVQLRPGDIKSEAYWAQYGISDKEAIKLVHEFNTSGFVGLRPIPGAVETLRSLSEQFDFQAVTARDSSVADQTKEWLARYFGDTISAVHFAGNKYVSKSVITKSEICRSIEAVCAIDDDADHIDDYINNGVAAVVFGDYEWVTYSRMIDVPRCKTWASVGDFLRASR